MGSEMCIRDRVMSADDRGAILGAMNSEVAAKITKIMDPES